MSNSRLRQVCADKLDASKHHTQDLSCLIGLDGFVDEIIHVVDKREDAETFTRLPTIEKMAERVAGAAGKSTNIELVNERTKLGGNGPIMANALSQFGLKVTYVGALGYPHIHPVFQPFAERADVYSICEAGHTDALEFDDGKVMLVKSSCLNAITWSTILERFGLDRFSRLFQRVQLIGFVNWTMIPFMSAIWEAILEHLCPACAGPRRIIFFDLADPAKRSAADIEKALELITRFQQYFDVILGLNEKEAGEIAAVYGWEKPASTPEAISSVAARIFEKLRLESLVVHPVPYAVATSGEKVDLVKGPSVKKPVITTGAGDHFNAGFCLGKLLRMTNEECLQLAVGSSGYYVRTGHSASVAELAEMLRTSYLKG